jgi:hypothetical protein
LDVIVAVANLIQYLIIILLFAFPIWIIIFMPVKNESKIQDIFIKIGALILFIIFLFALSESFLTLTSETIDTFILVIYFFAEIFFALFTLSRPFRILSVGAVIIFTYYRAKDMFSTCAQNDKNYAKNLLVGLVKFIMLIASGLFLLFLLSLIATISFFNSLPFY